MVRLKFRGICLINLLVYGLLLVSESARGQKLIPGDTIRIREVVISSRPVISGFPGFSSSDLDTTLISRLNPVSLAELFTLSSHLYIKSYGSGGSATSSLRGTGASHTRVSWNGISINNPMLGQTDFSLIAPGMIDNVRIIPGGTSSEAGSGSIGGTINLENRPDWRSGTRFSVNSSAGSFGTFSTLASVKAGSKRLLTVTRAFFSQAENDYPYLNKEIAEEPVKEIRKNSQFSRRDFLQELYVKGSGSVFSARIWYLSADRNLPGSMLIQSGVNREKQYDESFRSLVSYDHEKANTDYFIRAAWIFNRLDYTNPPASIESVNSSGSYIFSGGFETRIPKGITLKLLLDEEFNIISSNNYERNSSGNAASLTLMAERGAGNRLGTSLLIRETLDNNKLLAPDFAAGLKLRIFPGADHFISSGFSRNSRIPSMNDRYWNPGGNPGLKNEYAYLFDFGYDIDQNLSPSLKISSRTGIYRNFIRDMIRWHPSEFSYWIADNLDRVNTSGLESSVSLGWTHNSIRIDANASYKYTRAVSAGIETDASARPQLMYVPVNHADGSVYFETRNFYTLWITGFTGKRYITSDNSDHLPWYTLSSLVCGAKLKLNNNQIDINFRIGNIFNTIYQSIAFHPQPGRSYNISLSYQFNRSKK